MAKGWYERKDPALGKARRHSEVAKRKYMERALRAPVVGGGRSEDMKKVDLIRLLRKSEKKYQLLEIFYDNTSITGYVDGIDTKENFVSISRPSGSSANILLGSITQVDSVNKKRLWALA